MGNISHKPLETYKLKPKRDAHGLAGVTYQTTDNCRGRVYISTTIMENRMEVRHQTKNRISMGSRNPPTSYTSKRKKSI